MNARPPYNDARSLACPSDIAAREPQVQAQFNYLDREVNELQELLKQLQDRLHPVSMSMPKPEQTPNVKSPAPTLCGVADRIHSIMTTLESANVMLRNTLSALEI